MKWSILYFYHDLPANLVPLAQSNPNHQVIPIKIKDDRKTNWTNVDRLIRNHAKDVINEILYDDIFFFEWDVLVNKEIPEIEYDSVFCKHSYEPPQRNTPAWDNWWWKEVDKLPEFLRESAWGIFPASILGIKKKALLYLLDSKWDEVFDLNIHCEVRLPTILNYMGYRAQSWPKELGSEHLILDGPQVEAIKEIMKKDPNVKGIIHPVK